MLKHIVFPPFHYLLNNYTSTVTFNQRSQEPCSNHRPTCWAALNSGSSGLCVFVALQLWVGRCHPKEWPGLSSTPNHCWEVHHSVPDTTVTRFFTIGKAKITSKLTIKKIARHRKLSCFNTAPSKSHSNQQSHLLISIISSICLLKPFFWLSYVPGLFVDSIVLGKAATTYRAN